MNSSGNKLQHALLNYLRDHDVPMGTIPVAHAVVFPGVTLTGEVELGPSGPPDIV